MYFILNETNQIIAADADLLKKCGLTHIDQLNLNVALGNTKFDLNSENNLVITADENDTAYPVSKISLSSMLGHLTLVEIKESEETSTDALTAIMYEQPEAIAESSISSDLDMELFTIEPESDEIGLVTEPTEEDNILFDLDLDKGEEAVENIEEIATAPADETDILDLDLFIKKEEVHATEPLIDETAEILIDVKNVSQRMGISEEDYDTFLNEYINTALELENDLRGSDTQKRSDAVGTLSHLSDLLQLPMMSDMIAKIHTKEEEERKKIIESFYSALSRITTSPSLEKEPELELFNLEETVTEEPETTAEKSESGFGSISLEGIKPIHFDFRLEEAANDLSLPIDLIEEFVRDFIEQAHIETEKMLKAYEKGDLETIQKIGHLLKGASSNLRINPLSDTLYKIQFCEDFSQLEAYIKDYWAHFLSFEIQINALAK